MSMSHTACVAALSRRRKSRSMRYNVGNGIHPIAGREIARDHQSTCGAHWLGWRIGAEPDGGAWPGGQLSIANRENDRWHRRRRRRRYHGARRGQGPPDALGQTFVVENRPGAQGLVSLSAFTKERTDGYNLFMLASSQAVLPALYQLPYDPINDITPIARLTVASVILVVNPDLPVKSVKDLVDYPRKIRRRSRTDTRAARSRSPARCSRSSRALSRSPSRSPHPPRWRRKCWPAG